MTWSFSGVCSPRCSFDSHADKTARCPCHHLTERESEGQQQSPARDTVPGSKSSVLSRGTRGSWGRGPRPRSVGCPQCASVCPPPVMEKGRCSVQGLGEDMGDSLVGACKWLAQGCRKNSRNQQCTASARSRRQPLFLYWVTQPSLQPNWMLLLSHFTHGGQALRVICPRLHGLKPGGAWI